MVRPINVPTPGTRLKGNITKPHLRKIITREFNEGREKDKMEILRSEPNPLHLAIREDIDHNRKRLRAPTVERRRVGKG